MVVVLKGIVGVKHGIIVPAGLQAGQEHGRVVQCVPGQSRVLHADVERVDLAVGVEHGAVGAEEGDIEVAMYQGWVQGPQHRQALERLGVAELGLEGNPGPISKKAVEGGRYGGDKGFRGDAVDDDHLMQASGQAPLICVCVSFERERQGTDGQE